MSKPTKLVVVLSLLALGLLAAGCPRRPETSSRYYIAPVMPNAEAVSDRVLLVADNQLNNLFGDPYWLRSAATDRIVSVTIRPVQQDLFALDILGWTMEYYGSQMPVVHLGDGANVACVGELARFAAVMGTASQPWYMAPGNHDAFLLGNLDSKLSDWDDACQRADGPLTKDRLVRTYLEHLRAQDPAFAAATPGELPPSGEWHGAKEGPSMLRSVAWRIDPDARWRSFVVQELDLTLPGSPQRVSMILLDSSDFVERPVLAPTTHNAGVHGAVQGEQLEPVRRWLDDAPGALVVTATHHPFDTLDEASRGRLEALRAAYQVVLHVSAHTHRGQYFVHGESRNDGWLELNVGSISDWPIEFRTLSLHRDPAAPGELVFRSPLFRIPDTWDARVPPMAPRCDPRWEAQPGAPDFYLKLTYDHSPNPKKTHRDIMVTLLHTFRRLIETVPSAADNTAWPACCRSDAAVLAAIDDRLGRQDAAEMVPFLVELDAFDRTRRPADPQLHRDYRLCQAVWASKYDKLQRRQPATEDPFIVYRMEGAR